MKKLLLIWIFSGSLDGFSQASQYAICYHNTPACMCGTGEVVIRDTVNRRTAIKPDTLRAICLVTLGYRNLNVAHARMGFVVIAPDKRPVYLDCRKRALKLPQVGWGYVEVNPNVK